MWNWRVMGCAGLKRSLPSCEAVIVHQPAPVRCTVLPATAQGPEALSVTGRADVAEAFTLKPGSPTRLSASAANRIDWFFSVGHVAGALPSAEQTAPPVFGVLAHEEAARLVASSTAVPASRIPQPMSGVQSEAVRLADSLRMSAT